jgi:hypothetical protein
MIHRDAAVRGSASPPSSGFSVSRLFPRTVQFPRERPPSTAERSFHPPILGLFSARVSALRGAIWLETEFLLYSL